MSLCISGPDKVVQMKPSLLTPTLYPHPQAPSKSYPHLQVINTASPRGALRLLARRDGGLHLGLQLLQPLLRQPPQVLRLQQSCIVVCGGLGHKQNCPQTAKVVCTNHKQPQAIALSVT